MSPEANAAALPRMRLAPRRGWIGLNLRELWHAHELLYFMTWRDVKVRYKQTALGAAWAIIQPFFTMVVFTIVFGRLAGLSSDGRPYPIFVFAALVPWTFFASGLAHSADSLAGSANLIRKVYFPRLVIPLGTVMSNLVDFVIAFTVLLAMMAFYGIAPTHNVIWLPFFLVLALVTVLGVGLWLSALNVEYRDVKYVVPFIIQFWMFATPVAYSSNLLKEPWQRMLYGLNPMATVVEGFRWALLGTNTPPGQMAIVSTVAAVALLAGGAFYFRRLERSFADIV